MSVAGGRIRRLTVVAAVVGLAGLGLALPAGAATPSVAAYVSDARLNQVYVVDTATNTITATVPVGVSPRGMAVTPDGTRVYVADHGSSDVSVLDATTDTVTATIPVPDGAPNYVAMAPNGAHVYVSNDEDNTLEVIDTATNTITAKIQVGSVAWGVAVITPDGRSVYVASTNALTDTGEGAIFQIDAATNAVVATIPTPRPSALAISPDGTELTALDPTDNTLTRFSTATGQAVGTTQIPGSPQELAYSGGLIYVTGADGTVSVVSNGTVTRTTPVQGQVLGGIGATPDGSSLYLGNYFATGITVLDTASGTVKTVIPTPDSSQPYEVAIGVRSANVAVSLKASPAGLLVHQVTYTATAVNKGPGPVSSATVRFSYANGYVAPSAPGCTVDTSSRTATCELGAIAAGSSVTKSLRLTVGLLAISGSMPVTAMRTASTPTDPNPLNGSSTVNCAALTTLLVRCSP